MKYLYLDGSCGISGDMTVAALLDLGASRERLESAIHAMHLEGMHCHIERGNSYSIAGMNFDVHVHTHHGEESADNVDAHEEGYVEHHHEHSHEHHHDHCEEHHHEHELGEGHHHHEHSHEHGHHHEHRHLAEVYHILEHAAGHCAEHNPAAPAFSSNALDTAKKIFRIIAEAEAKAHGVAVEEVHFHEVGAIDSIVDIMAVAVLVDDLQEKFGVEKCVMTGLNEGSGFVQTQHGMLPIPVPAVASIAEAAGIALHVTDTKGEMVTPTGIGVVAALRTSEKLPEQYKILKTGIGLGKRDFGRANFLRAQIIEDIPVVTNLPACGDSENDKIFMIECNIDDQSPEELGLAMEKIFEAGARDVHYIPCYMKKNRPAVILRVLADEEKLPEIETTIFRHTTTVGLRRYPVSRTCMNRSFADIATPYGTVTVKKCELGDIAKYKPEFDSVKKVADQAGVTYREVADAAKANAKF